MSEVLIGGIEKREIVIVDYDPRWPAQFRQHAEIIARALGDRALAIEHVGSTSVPGLAAKAIIDIDVVVEDSSEEASYLPALVEAGYVLRVREPDWHEHRMFRTPELDVHVHLFSPGCVEVARHLAFRDWLRTHPEDRLLYDSVKRKLAGEDWADMNAYAGAKTEVVEEILGRALGGRPERGLMSTQSTTVPATPSPEVIRLLRAAIRELRHYPNDISNSSRFEHVHDVADYLEQLTNQLVAGNAVAGRELYTAFLATSTWDDAYGSHELGNQLCEVLRPYYPQA